MLEMGLFWIGAAMVLVAYLILLLDSYRHNKVWALVGMILIIPLLIHVPLNWSTLNVRKAFYTLIIGVLAILVSIAGGALAHLPFLQDHEVVQVLEENIAPPKVEPLPNEEQAKTTTLSKQKDYDPLLTGSEYEEVAVKEIASEAKKKTVNFNPSSRYQTITQEELKYAINKQIRMTMTNDEVIVGKLTNIEDDGVLVESSVNGGILGLSYQNSNIKNMEVLLFDGESLISEDIEVIEENSAEQVEEESMPANDQFIDQQPLEEIVKPITNEDNIDPQINHLQEQEVVDEVIEAVEEITQEAPISTQEPVE